MARTVGSVKRSKGLTKTGKCKKGTARKCGKSCMAKLKCKAKNSKVGKKKRKESILQLRGVGGYN